MVGETSHSESDQVEDGISARTADGDTPPAEPDAPGGTSSTVEPAIDGPAPLDAWWPGVVAALLALIVLVPFAIDDAFAMLLLLACGAGMLLAAVRGMVRIAPAIAGIGSFCLYIAFEEFAENPGRAVAVCLASAGAAIASGALAARSRSAAALVVTLDDRFRASRMRAQVEEHLQQGGRNSLLGRELSRSRRYRRPIALVLISIDNLDVHRDRLGDEAALAARLQLAETFSSVARLVDAGEVRDDGLLIVLPETGVRGARIVGERIRLAYSGLGLLGSDDVPISVSVGVASYPLDGDMAVDLLDGAVEALQRAIALGGNRTIVHQLEPSMPAGWAGHLPTVG